MKIRFRIKEVAKEKGISQGSLSRAANVDYKTVKRIFQDPYRDISASTLIKIAYALREKIDNLVTLEESEEPERWRD